MSEESARGEGNSPYPAGEVSRGCGGAAGRLHAVHASSTASSDATSSGRYRGSLAHLLLTGFSFTLSF